jgi:hypothetical protein
MWTDYRGSGFVFWMTISWRSLDFLLTLNMFCLYRYYNVVCEKYIWMEGMLLLLKLKVTFTLERAMKAQRGSRGIDLLFL